MNDLTLVHITKQFREHVVLNDISMVLSAGKVYGLVGRNGSGKTMLLRILAGLIRPSEGQIRLNGQKIVHKKNRRSLPRIGLILEHAGLYPHLTGRENLRTLAKIRRLADETAITDSICRVGLDPDDKRVYREYSLGMKQRLLVAQAIMEKPDILLLDEPTSALDENGRELIRKIILEEAERGALVIVASHSDEEISQCCDQVFAMQEGILTPKPDIYGSEQ